MLQKLLFGKLATCSKRSAEIAFISENIGQKLLYNVASDEQIKHIPVAKGSAFPQEAKSSLAVSLLLPIHQVTLKESLVTFINKQTFTNCVHGYDRACNVHANDVRRTRKFMHAFYCSL